MDKPKIINCKVDVSKIDAKRFFAGKKGTYLNFTLIQKDSEYSDYVIVQDVTKEEREAGVRGEILGNGKIAERKEKPPAQAPAWCGQQATPPAPDPSNNAVSDNPDDVPF